MKKHYLFFVIFLLSLRVWSQNQDYSRYYNSWRLGLNIGGTWQTCDMRSRAGLGGGITLEKGLFENSTNFFSLAIRGRYLAGNTYGIGTTRNYDIKGNDALNGKYDPTVNYVDSMPAGKRYVYDNYKMTYGEGALELQLSFNRLRERTHVLLNLWGGVGITSFSVKTNMKDANNHMYDFSTVDSSGNTTKTLSSLKSMYDHSYESTAYGSKGGNIITFSPSCGIGLGYQFSPGFSVLFEYKLTFPQGVNADLLDGKLGQNKSWIAGNNDYYHYANINLLFTLRGKKHATVNHDYTIAEPTHTVVPTYTNVPTNSVTVNDPVPTSTVITSTPYNIPKPVVNFTSPSVSSSVVSGPQYMIQAQVLNVENASQIQLKVNGFGQSNFSFNPQTHMLEYSLTMLEGTNFVKIKATNLSGSDSKTVFIEYQKPQLNPPPQGNPPQVAIINPASSPYTTQTPQYNLYANVFGVASANNITATVNGIGTTNFSFNPATNQLTMPLNLVQGSNLVSITAANAFGTDTKTSTIILQGSLQTQQPAPVVSFIMPSQNPLSTMVSVCAIKAQVLHITTQNQASATVNGQPVAFLYDNNQKQINFQASLVQGNNIITVSSSNNSGSDTKSTIVVYNQKKDPGQPPSVSFVVPASQYNATDNQAYAFKAVVVGVGSQSDITVTFNGVQVYSFAYNAATKEVTFSSPLSTGNNNLTIQATNGYGTDSKSANVNYIPHQDIKLPPLITFTQPSSSGTVTYNNAFDFKAVIQNITSPAQLSVSLNGRPVSGFNLSAGNFDFNALLQNGPNMLTITASNNDGSDTKTATVMKSARTILQPPVITITQPVGNPVVNNPAYTFMFNVTHAQQNQVTVKLNGNVVPSYNFMSGAGSLVANLAAGLNILEVSAATADGSDYKKEAVTYQQSNNVDPIGNVDITLPPNVKFTNPPTSPYDSYDSIFVYKAQVLNVTSRSQIQVTFNSVPVNNFTFNASTLEVTYTTPLVRANYNILSITVTNSAGSRQKSATVKSQRQVATPPPPTPPPTPTSPVPSDSSKMIRGNMIKGGRIGRP